MLTGDMQLWKSSMSFKQTGVRGAEPSRYAKKSHDKILKFDELWARL
jgi:hypothetical protein